MKRRISLFVLAFLLLVPLGALALEGKAGDIVTLDSDQTINANYYVAGQDIEIFGTVNGDLFLAGQNIVIDSENINGDIFAAGNSLVIKGQINGSVRFAGQRLSVEGEIADNVMFLGQGLKVDQDSLVGGHLSFWGQYLNINGTVEGNVEGGISKLRLAGTIGQNIDLYLDNTTDNPIELTDEAVVSGTLYYQSFNEKEVNPNAEIAGGISFNEMTKDKDHKTVAGMMLDWLTKFFGILIVGMVFIYLWPKLMPYLHSRAKKHPVKNFFLGLATLILTPIVVIILAITMIGLPLAFLLAGLWALALYLAKVVGAWLVGRFIQKKVFPKRDWSKLMILSVGAFVYVLVGAIPFVGWILVSLVYILAFGSLTYALYHSREK